MKSLKNILRRRTLFIVIVVSVMVVGVLALMLTRAATTVISVNDNTIGTGANQWQYTGTNWQYYTDGGNKYMGDDHGSAAAGDYATLRFDGIKAEYYGAKSPQAGIVAISVDNGPEQIVDLYSATRFDNTLLFSTPTMNDGAHTLKIRLTGTKNPSATGAAAAVDRAVVTMTAGSGNYANLEVEDGAVTGSASLVSDSSASGGRSVQFKAASTPPPPTGSAPMPFPNKAVGLYHMMWSNSPNVKLSNTPPNVNVVYMAFAQGDPPSMVGWSPQGEASFIADANALRARGVRMVISVGGAGGHINTSNRQAFVNGIMAINNKVPLDGLDWDVEGISLNQADMVWISQELKRVRGSNFAITMAPGGGAIHSYPPIAVALNNVGALDMIAWQFYDTVHSRSTIISQVDRLVGMGLPQDKIGIGMMVGDADIYSTVDEWVGHIQAVEQKYPNFRGGFLWEAGRAGTADWANRVGNIILN